MLSWLELIWWFAWMAGVGAAIGSFANVLIYRLPRGPVFRPAWSFCPCCERRILFRDNIPLYSFLARRGRCRHCGEPIALRYPLIEAVTILAFLLVFDALFVAAVRPDIADPDAASITDRVLSAWPMLVAHLVLVGGLLVISVIDLEEYWVDLRVILVIVGIGALCHMLWNPGGQGVWQPPSAPAAAACFGAAVGLALAQLWSWLTSRPPTAEADAPDAGEPRLAEPPEAAEPDAATNGQSNAAAGPQDMAAPQPPPGAARATPPAPERGGELRRQPRVRLAAGWVVAGLTLAGALSIVGGHLSGHQMLSFWRRSSGVFLLLFVAQLVGSARRRPADRAIVVAIEQERHSARGMAAGELVFLLPAALLAGLGALGAHAGFWGQLDWSAWYHWSPISGWLPVAGLARSACGALIAGGVGWAVRIGFTLLLGREAFGLGDVYLMAAAGAVAGWAVAVLGFFVAAVFALGGVLLLIVFKRSRAIPFGPWLSLGILAVLVAYEPMRQSLAPGLRGLAVLTGLTAPTPPQLPSF